GPWRDTVNAATMLGQSKTAFQAEIDAACELCDFLRFNVAYMLRIYEEQPNSPPGTWNRLEYRPLEGFVLAVTPFNFTSIAGNLPAAPALMGCTVVWKPSESAAYSAHQLMRLFQAAGLPDGVINLVHGPGAELAQAAIASSELAGVHFTGSTAAFRGIWIEEARTKPGHQVLAGGGTNSDEGWFVQPTVVVTDDPRSRLLREELFGPMVTVLRYPDDRYQETLDLIDRSTPYGLTGAVFARDRTAIETAH